MSATWCGRLALVLRGGRAGDGSGGVGCNDVVERVLPLVLISFLSGLW